MAKKTKRRRGIIKATDILIQTRIPATAARAWAQRAKSLGESRAMLVRKLLIDHA